MRHRFRRSPTVVIITLVLLLVVLATALGACGSELSAATTAAPPTSAVASSETTAPPTTEVSTTTTAGEPQELLVSAAAGLKTAFTKIGELFDQKNNAKTTFNFAASGVLQKQIESGAPGDVFASADPKQMNALLKANLADASSVTTFASNEVVLIVPADSTLGITSFQDLAKADVKRVATGDPDTTPLGVATLKILPALNMEDSVKPKLIYSETVNQTLQYVSSGEVDAGIVWTSEALAGGDKVKVAATADPSWYGGKAEFVIGRVTASANKDLGQTFIDFVLSADGQTILKSYGFLPPPAN
jgi:molybdate transport system substrate-binding protein